MKKLLLQCSVLLLVAIVGGFLINIGHWLHCAQRACSTETIGEDYLPLPVTVPQVLAWQRQKQLIVDARSAEAYSEGHIPTARSVPRGDRRALAKVVDCCLLQERVLVYCSGEQCEDSFVVGEELFHAGFTTVMLYDGGFADWQQRGLSVERGMP